MPRFVAFLGGINVGGHRVTMDRLCGVFEGTGCRDVTTFLASGNVLFTTAKRDRGALEATLGDRLEAELGYKVPTFLRTAEEVAAAVRYEPFEVRDIEAEGHTLHVCFLRRALTETEQGVARSASTPMDELHPHASELYWLCRGRLTDSLLKWRPLSKRLCESTARNITMLRRLCARPDFSTGDSGASSQ